MGVGTGLAFITLPKRSVTALGITNGYLQDLDARRTITTKTTRSRSITIKTPLYPVTEFAIASFDNKKENLAPPLTPRGFLLADRRHTPALKAAPDADFATW